MALSWFRSRVAGALTKALDTKLPEDRALVKALIIWAESKLPDRGQGRARWELAVTKLEALYPGTSRFHKELVELIEELVSEIDEELEKASSTGTQD